MPIKPSNLGRHHRASLQALGNRTVQRILALAGFSIVFSILFAPQGSPSVWDWTRIVVISVCTGLATLIFASSQDHRHPVEDRRQHLIAATILVGLALVLNLTFSLVTTLIFSTGLSVLGIMLANDSGLNSARTVGAIVAGTIPLWIWSALDAWTTAALLLIPLGAIAIIADGHMRLASLPASDQRSLSRRGHRLAARAGILGAALLSLIAALAVDAGTGVVALGALGALALVTIEASSTTPTLGSWRASSVALIDLAAFWIALCWIVSL